MEKIEKEEHVRTKTGKIGKVLSIDEDPEWIETTLDKGNVMHISEVKKHSKQLIDIIEPGDILEIEEEGYEEKYECLKSDKGLSIYVPISDYYKRIEDLKIKRVLTKEQFRQNSYEVGGKEC